MSGDSLKGALFNGVRRLSSGRHVKPKRAFSPEQSVSTPVSKKNAKKSGSELVDSMNRSHLMDQLATAPPCDFELPPDFLVSDGEEEEEEPATSCKNRLEDIQPSTSTETDVDEGFKLSADFYDLIDYDALDTTAPPSEKSVTEENDSKSTSARSRRTRNTVHNYKNTSTVKYLEHKFDERPSLIISSALEVSPSRNRGRKRKNNAREMSASNDVDDVKCKIQDVLTQEESTSKEHYMDFATENSIIQKENEDDAVTIATTKDVADDNADVSFHSDVLEEPEEIEYELAPSSSEKSIHADDELDDNEISIAQSPSGSQCSEIVLCHDASPSPLLHSVVTSPLFTSVNRETQEEKEVKVLYDCMSVFNDDKTTEIMRKQRQLSISSNSQRDVKNTECDADKLSPNSSKSVTLERKNELDIEKLPETTSENNCVTKSDTSSSSFRDLVTYTSNSIHIEATATATITKLQPVCLPTHTTFISATNNKRSIRSSRSSINYLSMLNGDINYKKFSRTSLNFNEQHQHTSAPMPTVYLRSRKKLNESDSLLLTMPVKRKGKLINIESKESDPHFDRLTDQEREIRSDVTAPENETKTSLSPEVYSAKKLDRSAIQSPSKQLLIPTASENIILSNVNENDSKVALADTEIVLITTTSPSNTSNVRDTPASIVDQFPSLCVKIEDSNNFENKILHEMKKSKGTHSRSTTPLSSKSPQLAGSATREASVVTTLSNRPQRNRFTRLSEDFVYPDISNGRKGSHFRIDSPQVKQNDKEDESHTITSIKPTAKKKELVKGMCTTPPASSQPITSTARPQRQRGTKLCDDYFYPSVINSKKIVANTSTTSEPVVEKVTKALEIVKQQRESVELTNISTAVTPTVTRKRKVGRPPLDTSIEAKRSKINATSMFSRRRREEERRRKQKQFMDNKPKLKFAAMRKANLVARVFSSNNRPSRFVVDDDTKIPHEPIQPSDGKPSKRNYRSKTSRPLSIKIDDTSLNELALRSPRTDGSSYPSYGFPVFSEDCASELGFAERLALCRALNPLSRGVVNRPNGFIEDFFYREILKIRSSERNDEMSGRSRIENGTEMEIDVCGDKLLENRENDPFRAELLVSSPAEQCAADVHKVMRANHVLMVSDVDDGPTLESILRERASKEPMAVAEHLNMFMRYVFLQRLTDLSTLNTQAGPSMFYSMSLTNANRLRESLRLYNKKRLLSMVHAHCWLLNNLPVSLLSAYLNLLRFLKVAGSNLSKHVVDKCEIPEIRSANAIINQFLSVKMYDPPTGSTAKVMAGMEPLKNVSLLLVYPQVSVQESYAHIIKPYEPLFKNLLPRVTQVAEKVDFRLELNASDNLELCARLYVQRIVKHVRDIVKRRPNDHVFLAGWGTSCLLNHKAVSMVPGVSGILDFAFPAESAIGPRGEVDDEICLTYCPSLFIVGENAADCMLSNLQRMRCNLLVDSGLIVVGAANRNLFVSSQRLSMERVSQKCVDRAIVDGVIEFMRVVIEDLGPPTSECRDLLKPIDLPHIYEVDMSALKHGTLNADKEAKRVGAIPMDDTGVQNGDHHYIKEKPRRKYTKSADRKPRKRKNEELLNAEDNHHYFLTCPPPGFCTPADSVPVVDGISSDFTGYVDSRQSFTAPLTSARNSFNTSLKKAVALVGRDAMDLVERPHQTGNSSEFSSSIYFKIPTPSMLNKQLPPPLPTISSVTSLPHQPILPGTHSSPNMPIPASSRPLPPLMSPFSSNDMLSPSISEAPVKDKESITAEQDLLQEEQAAAAAILGQLPNF